MNNLHPPPNAIHNPLAPSDGINNPILTGPVQTATGVQYIQALIPRLVTMLLVVGSLIFFFMLLIGGIQWIASGGDKGALEGAKSRITSAIVGLLIMLSSFVIIKLIEAFFGVSILTLDISPLIIQ